MLRHRLLEGGQILGLQLLLHLVELLLGQLSRLRLAQLLELLPRRFKIWRWRFWRDDETSIFYGLLDHVVEPNEVLVKTNDRKVRLLECGETRPKVGSIKKKTISGSIILRGR